MNNDRVAFVLTSIGHLKRVQFLDMIKDRAEQGEATDTGDEQFDIDFALMTGELSQLIKELIVELGGEIAPTQQAAA